MAREAASARINIEYHPISTRFQTAVDFAKYYNGDTARRAAIGHVALRFLRDPDAVLEFDLKAGTNREDRDFSGMMDNLQGYCEVLAQTAHERGYNLHIHSVLNRRVREFQRVDYDTREPLADEPDLPVKHLLLEEKPFAAPHYNNGDLIGYRMQAKLTSIPPTK